MQRLTAFLLVVTALLYSGCTTTPKPAPVAPAEAAPPAAAVRAEESARTAAYPLPQPTPPPQPLPLADSHIALLLPLKSTSFGTAAQAVRAGFLAAMRLQAQPLPVRVYPTTEQPEDILAAYRAALQQGARVIVGPLTKNAVTALAESGLAGAPTLALNVPDKDVAAPAAFYLFGLPVEDEARQIAALARAEGRQTALTVAADTALARRMQAAFAEEWHKLDGRIVLQLNLAGGSNYAPLHEAVLAHPADMIFLAMDAAQARLVRPHLDAAVPTYATSQVYDDRSAPQKNIDLNGIRFIDMPWLLQPDHPAVMSYPPPEAPASAELARLYALGIDAGRLAPLLLAPDFGLRQGTVLDGVTGRISLTSGQRLLRQLTPAQFQQGQALVLENAAP